MVNERITQSNVINVLSSQEGSGSKKNEAIGKFKLWMVKKTKDQDKKHDTSKVINYRDVLTSAKNDRIKQGKKIENRTIKNIRIKAQKNLRDFQKSAGIETASDKIKAKYSSSDASKKDIGAIRNSEAAKRKAKLNNESKIEKDVKRVVHEGLNRFKDVFVESAVDKVKAKYSDSTKDTQAIRKIEASKRAAVFKKSGGIDQRIKNSIQNGINDIKKRISSDSDIVDGIKAKHQLTKNSLTEDVQSVSGDSGFGSSESLNFSDNDSIDGSEYSLNSSVSDPDIDISDYDSIEGSEYSSSSSEADSNIDGKENSEKLFILEKNSIIRSLRSKSDSSLFSKLFKEKSNDSRKGVLVSSFIKINMMDSQIRSKELSKLSLEIKEVTSLLDNAKPLFDIIQQQSVWKGEAIPKEVSEFKTHLENMHQAVANCHDSASMEQTVSSVIKADKAMLFFEGLNKLFPEHLAQIIYAGDNTSDAQFLSNKILDSLSLSKDDWLYNIDQKELLNTVSVFYEALNVNESNPDEDMNSIVAIHQAFESIKDRVFQDVDFFEKMMSQSIESIEELRQMEYVFSVWDKKNDIKSMNVKLKSVQKDYKNEVIETGFKAIPLIQSHQDWVAEESQACSKKIFEELSLEVQKTVKQYMTSKLSASTLDHIKHKDFSLAVSDSNEELIKKVEKQLNKELQGIAHLEISIDPANPEEYLSRVVVDLKNTEEHVDRFNQFLYSESPCAKQLLQSFNSIKNQNILMLDSQTKQLLWMREPPEMIKEYTKDFMELYGQCMQALDEKEKVEDSVDRTIQLNSKITNISSMLVGILNSVDLSQAKADDFAVKTLPRLVGDVGNLPNYQLIDLLSHIEALEKKTIVFLEQSTLVEKPVIALFKHLSDMRLVLADKESQSIEESQCQIPKPLSSKLERIEQQLTSKTIQSITANKKIALNKVKRMMSVASQCPQSINQTSAMLDQLASKVDKDKPFYKELSSIVLSYSNHLKQLVV